MIQLLVPALVALFLLTACSDGENYDQVVIVQLFKPTGAELGPVTVTATQGTAQRSITVTNPFTDCDANQLRIVPRQEGDSYPDMTIRAEAANGGLFAEVIVPVPRTTPVKLIIGQPTTSIEPSGTCTPQLTPDAGIRDTGVEDAAVDDATIQYELGESCENNTQCEDGACINSFSLAGADTYQFSGGYCTRDCALDKTCPAQSSCELSSTLGGQVFGWFCLKTCDGAHPCSRSGYQCRGEFCLP